MREELIRGVLDIFNGMQDVNYNEGGQTRNGKLRF
jgi:hypothetical protein